jgi:cyclic pyranopterin phosphate synthase
LAKKAADPLPHFDSDGLPRMVDVSHKQSTARTAVATGFVRMSAEALDVVSTQSGKKGNAAAVAELAGVMAAKRTAELIPLCHALALTNAQVEASVDETAGGVRVIARVQTTGPTGVEMEALTAASIACLTLYDMLKSIDRSMVIECIQLVEKSGGSSGHFKKGSRGA